MRSIRHVRREVLSGSESFYRSARILAVLEQQWAQKTAILFPINLVLQGFDCWSCRFGRNPSSIHKRDFYTIVTARDRRSILRCDDAPAKNTPSLVEIVFPFLN
jgi:hypothetical protein